MIVSRINEDGKIVKDESLSTFMDQKRVFCLPVFDCGNENGFPGYIVFYTDTGKKPKN